MKELHNHIFSNTTCISKETMLRYINKQLSKNELYEVEKHMLDCELCSDAYEGIQFAQNSSMLFAIDNQIDQRVGLGNSKAPIMRNLMMAASVLVIIFGAYFTINYFNSTINNEKELAVNSVEKPKQENFVQKNKEIEEISNIQDDNLFADETVGKEATLLDENNKKQEILKRNDKFRIVANEITPVTKEQAPVVDKVDFLLEDEEENYNVAANESVEQQVNVKGERAKELEVLSDVLTSSNNRENDLSSTTTKNTSYGYTQADEDKTDLLKKEPKKSKNKARSSKGKKRYKSVAPTKAYFSDGSLEEDADFKAEKPKFKTITINSYKVVDYTEEYQEEYDLKNAATIETTSISADFESKEDAAIAEKERVETIIEISYKETLEKAIKLYKNQKYNEAIAQFDIILATHPEEVNSLFYGGLSNYHLQRYDNANKKLNKVLSNKVTEFNEEASWYKALTLIELNQIDKAKKLLKEIVAAKGFYKIKAEEKLKEIQ